MNATNPRFTITRPFTIQSQKQNSGLSVTEPGQSWINTQNKKQTPMRLNLRMLLLTPPSLYIGTCLGGSSPMCNMKRIKHFCCRNPHYGMFTRKTLDMDLSGGQASREPFAPNLDFLIQVMEATHQPCFCFFLDGGWLFATVHPFTDSIIAACTS